MRWDKSGLIVLLAILNQLLFINPGRGQGAAFTYQGWLNDANGPANGAYDFQFGLYATNAGGAVIAGPVTNSAIVVSNGLFLAAIDFGNVFNGTNYWLDVAVRTNGSRLFTELNPRQPITPAPAALFAASAGMVSGTVPVGQMDTNALYALMAKQAAQIFATSSIPALTATNLTNIVIGVTASSSFLNNLSGTLNSVISSNPPVVGNDILLFTNQNLSASSIGGIVSSVASQSNAVVMIMGDSYTDGTGIENSGQGGGMSTAWVFGSMLRNVFGDDGAAGTCNGAGYGWGNSTAHIFTSFSPAIWPLGNSLCLMTTNATNNVMWTGQNPGYYNGITPMPTNYVNLAGMCYITTPTGGSNNITIWSINGRYTNTVGISTYGAATNFIRTNWPVPPASDYTMVITNLSGTNILFCPLFLNTNRGVQYVQFGFAGKCLDQYLTGWSNLWVQIFAAFNPDVFIFNNIHWPYSYDVNGNTSMAWSNQMASLSAMLPAKTKITLVGQPPNVANNMLELNYQYRLLCQAQNWSYADLWSQFPSFTNSFSLGLFENDGVHPNTAGMIARSAALYKEMNFGTAFPVTVDVRNISGIGGLTNNIAPTNSSAAITAKSFNGAFNGNGANLTNIPYAALTGAPVLGTVAVLSSNDVVNMASNAVATSAYFATNSFSLNSFSALVSLVETQAIQQISTSAIPAGNITGVISLTNLPSIFNTNPLSGAIINALDAGCVNDGVTDNYAAIQQLVSHPGTYLFPPGSYLVNGTIYPASGVSLQGVGATIIFGPMQTGAPFVFTNHNCLFSGFTITGNQFTDVSSWHFPCLPTVGGPFALANSVVGSQNKFGNWYGANNRFGLIANACDGNFYNNLTILGFNGAAILPFTYYGQSSFSQPGAVFSAIDCYSNMVGVFAASGIGGSFSIYQYPWITNFVPSAPTSGNGCDPQYVKFFAVHCHDNGIGFDVSGANNIFDSCGADYNWVQVFGSGGSNPSGVTYHGRYVNGTINHDRALSIVLNGATTGFNIANCGLACLNYNFAQCSGVRIHGCDMAAAPAVTNVNSGGGWNEMFDNTYASAWITNAINNDGHFRFYCNHARDSVTDNDGAALTLILYGGNAFGLTNLNASAIMGTLTTNISLPGGATLYITNGLITSYH